MTSRHGARRVRHGVCSRVTLGLAVGLALLGPRTAQAADPRVVLSTPEEASSVAVRIAAELRALHFEVVQVEAPEGPPSREPLESAARQNNAVAAVRLVPSGAGVEVWIVDRVTGKTVLREIVSDQARSAAAESDIALRVMELLRASLMELNAPRPPPGEVEPPPPVRELVRSTPATMPVQAAPPAMPSPVSLSLHAGGGAMAHAGTLAPTGLVSVGLSVRPLPWIGPSALVLIPVTEEVLRGPEGTAKVRMGLIGVGAESVLSPRGSAWSMTVSAGVSLFWMSTTGDSTGRFLRDTSLEVFTAAPYLRAGARFAVVPRLHLRADLLGGVTVQEPVVRFAGREVAAFGAAFVVPSLAVELAWP